MYCDFWQDSWQDDVSGRTTVHLQLLVYRLGLNEKAKEDIKHKEGWRQGSGRV